MLNPLKRMDAHIMDDTDLAGPLFFALMLGVFLLLVCSVHAHARSHTLTRIIRNNNKTNTNIPTVMGDTDLAGPLFFYFYV